MVALKFISRGLVYSIYGIDRCDSESEESIILPFLNVDIDTIWIDFIWIVANMLIFRVATFLLMYFKFSSCSLSDCLIWFQKLFWNEKLLELSTVSKLIQNNPSVSTAHIVYVPTLSTDKTFSKVTTTTISTISTISHSQVLIQTKLPDSRPNQILIGWRDLSLYQTQSKFDFSNGSSKSCLKILNNLNGHLQFGTLTGLMGTSGAGKTSLLKVLNGQCKSRLSNDSKFYLSKSTKIR